VENFVYLPSRSPDTLCETSSTVSGIFYHKPWTISEDFQASRLVYVQAFLQNSSPDNIPKNIKYIT
jgi:hypothetical protein